MSNTLNDEKDQDRPERQMIRENFNSMFAGGRSFSGHERNCCYLNTGAFPNAGGRFANISSASGIDFPDDGRALAIVDWDHDGDLDIWTSNRNAPRLRFLRNNADRSGHFLSLRLVGNGTTTNRDAIGARVEVVFGQAEVRSKTDDSSSDASPPPLTETLRAGEGFLSQNSKWLHFGLASAEHIEKVIVHWPGGETEEFRGLEADNRYILAQNSRVAKVVPIISRNIQLTAQEQLPVSLGDVPFRLTTPMEIPPLSFQTWSGETQPIEARKGQSLLVNFWASWCRPCLEELKDIGKADERIRSSNLDVLALSIDDLDGEPLDTADASKILDSAQFHFRSGRAEKNLIRRLQTLNVLKTENNEIPLPFSILLDYRGRLAAVYRGPISIEQVLGDIDDFDDDILARFQRAAPFEGRSLDHQVAREALQRAEADARFKYANLLRQAGLLEMAKAQYEMVLGILPESYLAHSAIAAVLIQLGQPKLAIKHLEKSLQIDPDSVAAHINLGGIYVNQQQPLRAKTHYDKANELSPNDPQVLYNRAMVQESLGNSDAALEDYSKATALQPDFVEAYFKRGTLYVKLQDFNAAVDDFSEVLRLKPDYAPAYKKRGLAYLQAGLFEQSLRDLSKALKLLPQDEAIYNNRGMAYAALNNFAFAMSDYKQAIDINHEAPQVYNNLAWLLATCPEPRHRNGEQALNYAKQACELSQWSYFGALDTLAAAYAEVGRFNDAVKWQKRSIEYAPDAIKEELRSRLALYETGKPYRQSVTD